MRPCFACVCLLLLAWSVLTPARCEVDPYWYVSMRVTSDAIARAYSFDTAEFGTRPGATDGPPADPEPIDARFAVPPSRVALARCVDLGGDALWRIDCRAPLQSGEKVWHILAYAGGTFASDTLYVTLWNGISVADAAPDDGLRIVLYSVEEFGGARSLVGELDLTVNGYFSSLSGISGHYIQVALPFAVGEVGDSAHPYKFELVATAGGEAPPAVVDEGIYAAATGSHAASWTAASPDDVLEYSYALGVTQESLLVGWTSAGTATHATVSGLALQPGATYRWFVRARYASGWGPVGASDGMTAAIVSSVGQSRQSLAGRAVILRGVTVTSGAAEAPGLWVCSADRSAGLKIDAPWDTARDERIDAAGIVAWTDGVPVLTSPELKSRTPGQPLRPLGVSGRSAVGDLRGDLCYAGPNPVGLLLAVAGTVTAVDENGFMFYVDDGSTLSDGIGRTGLRVRCAPGTLLPAAGSHVRVTGVRTVTKEAVYIPEIATRCQDDILLIGSDRSQ